MCVCERGCEGVCLFNNIDIQLKAKVTQKLAAVKMAAVLVYCFPV